MNLPIDANLVIIIVAMLTAGSLVKKLGECYFLRDRLDYPHLCPFHFQHRWLRLLTFYLPSTLLSALAGTLLYQQRWWLVTIAVAYLVSAFLGGRLRARINVLRELIRQRLENGMAEEAARREAADLLRARLQEVAQARADT